VARGPRKSMLENGVIIMEIWSCITVNIGTNLHTYENDYAQRSLRKCDTREWMDRDWAIKEQV